MSHANPVSKKTGGRNRRAMRLLSYYVGQEIEMVRRTFAMADGQSMPDRFCEIGLGRLNRIRQRFASRQLRRDRRGKRTAGAMRMRGIDEIPFEDVKKLAVI